MIPASVFHEPEKYAGLLDNLGDGVYIVDRNRKIRYWNPAAEQISGFGPGDVVGRCCADNILMHVDDAGCELCKHDCPLAHTMDDSQTRSALVHLHHKQGHRVTVQVRCEAITDEHDQVVGAVEIFSPQFADRLLDEELSSLRQDMHLDTLTEAPNRRYMDHLLQWHIDRTRRLGDPLGVLFIDLDDFKMINDEFGHEAGDRTLQTVTRTLAAAVRPHDHFGRWGGEEFLMTLSNISPQAMTDFALRLGMLIRTTWVHLDEETTVQVTASIGGALLGPDDDLESLVARADEAMYQSKKEDGDRFTLLPTPDATDRTAV